MFKRKERFSVASFEALQSTAAAVAASAASAAIATEEVAAVSEQ